jgi:hemin uptake protein HemP
MRRGDGEPLSIQAHDKLVIKNDSHYSGVMLVDSRLPHPPACQPDLTRRAGEPLRIDSAALLGPQGEVHIVHQQQLYRLRVTSLGKLILTK